MKRKNKVETVPDLPFGNQTRMTSVIEKEMHSIALKILNVDEQTPKIYKRRGNK